MRHRNFNLAHKPRSLRPLAGRTPDAPISRFFLSIPARPRQNTSQILRRRPYFRAQTQRLTSERFSLLARQPRKTTRRYFHHPRFAIHEAVKAAIHNDFSITPERPASLRLARATRYATHEATRPLTACPPVFSTSAWTYAFGADPIPLPAQQDHSQHSASCSAHHNKPPRSSRFRLSRLKTTAARPLRAPPSIKARRP